MTLTGTPAVRFVRPDIGIVVATTSVSRSGDPSGHDATQTLVVMHEPDGWRIGAFHNTRRASPGSAADEPPRDGR